MSISLGARAGRMMRRGAVLTDVGSTKAVIARELERAMPQGIDFVGAHPIAGSEQQGIGAASAALFDGSVCIVTPTARTNPRALRRVESLWRPLVADLIRMTPARHDRVLAATSHLPHLLAFCLADSVDAAPLLPKAPRSLLDMTRIARSSPQLWDDIFFSNRPALLQAIARFDRRWRAYKDRLARGRRRELTALLGRARAKRGALDD